MISAIRLTSHGARPRNLSFKHEIKPAGGMPYGCPLHFAEKRIIMALDYEESKDKIVEKLQKKLKTKSKFYFNDLAKILEAKPREAKKVINRMIQEEVLEYWSSGSTSLYGLKGTGKQAGAEHEEKE
jgi:nicotinamidase-related amidase